MTRPLRPEDPGYVDRALAMVRGKGYVAIALRRTLDASTETLTGQAALARVAVRWRADDDVRATVRSGRLGLPTWFRLTTTRYRDGTLVLRGRALNLTHWLFAVAFTPVVVLSGLATVGTAIDRLWGPCFFAATITALASFGWWRLGTRRGFVALRAGHLVDLAQVLWESTGTPAAPRPL